MPVREHVDLQLRREHHRFHLGVWRAHAWLGSSGGANGHGATAEAVADLRAAVCMVIEEDGVPAQPGFSRSRGG